VFNENKNEFSWSNLSICVISIFQSNVQLGLDFLSPESLGDAVRFTEEIRCLPNEHESKVQVLEVRRGKSYI